MGNSTLSGTVLAVVVLGLATVYGLLRRRRDGQLRPVPAHPGERPRRAGPRSPSAMPTDPVPGADQATTAAPAGDGPDLSGDGEGERLDPALLTELRVDPDAAVTLLQFSSAFCAPCRATRHVLTSVSTALDGVRHVEVDAESHLTVVRQLDVWRTPTTFVLASGGRVVARASGVPGRAQVLAAVAPLLGTAYRAGPDGSTDHRATAPPS